MNKKMFLLPFLAVSLLVGCTGGKEASHSGSASGSGSSQTSSQSGGGESSQSSQGQKEIWELDEVEGESTFAEVKAGEAEQYYTVRGTVVANSGSTLAIYRKGQFLYCYNFKAGEHDNLEEHALGAYVEIHAQSSKYEGSTQLTAYNVGAEKNEHNYDLAASLKVLQAQGEEVAPVKITEADQLSNANGAGMLMELSFVPEADKTFAVDTANNQDLKGKVAGADFTIRMEKYLPQDVQTALTTANDPQFLDHGTYKVVALGAATSSGNVRGLLVEGSSWVKTADPHFDDPTSVLLDCTEDEVEVGGKITLEWQVLPLTAKQAVTFTSSDDTKATVDEKGVVRGVAAGDVVITAAATALPTVKATFEVTVKPASGPAYTSVGALSFNKNANVTINNELSDGTDPKITYSENGVSIVVRKNTSDSNVNVWKADFASCRWYVGHQVIISSETAFKRVVLTCDKDYNVFKNSAEGVIENVSGGASVSYDTDEYKIILELSAAATSITIVPDKQLRPNNVELFKIA